MKLGGDNDPTQVKQLQALLGVLGLGTPPTDGAFDRTTEDAVKAAQQRLGLKPTGRASSSLLSKLITAHALSPCIKRSADGRDEYELLRAAVARGDFDDEDENRGRLIVRSGEILRYQRFWPLEDIEISRAHTDGRTVVAYATVFDTPYPVSDQYGEYDETVERSAFNKWLADGNISRAMCLYNHGYTIHGSPSDAYSVPLGQPLEITPDGRGLKTVTRYNKGPDVDRVLEAISNHAITGQSFRGRIVRSTPNNRRYSTTRDGARTMVTRHELGLTDYGPTPMPVNAGAEILAVRSLAAQLGVSGDQLAELIRNLSPTTPYDEEPEADATTSDETEAGAEEPQAVRSQHSGRQEDIARRIRVEQILKGITK
jgi:HK97 family phage prohead protease